MHFMNCLKTKLVIVSIQLKDHKSYLSYLLAFRVTMNAFQEVEVHIPLVISFTAFIANHNYANSSR